MTCDKLRSDYYSNVNNCQGKNELCDSNGSCCAGLSKICLIILR